MTKTSKRLFTFLALTVLLLGTGAGCGKKDTGGKDAPKAAPKEINLTMWGVFDDSNVIQPLIDKFNKTKGYSHITITYSKKDYADYESGLVDAMAAGKGPDILYIHDDWLPKHKGKLVPAPKEIFSIEDYAEKFIPVAYQNFTDNNKVYGVPLYTDNLALFWNKELFKKSLLYNPPATWKEVINYVSILTKKVPGDPTKIQTGGIALGTTNNISRSSDILLAMMLQNETPIISSDLRSFNFNQFRKSADGSQVYPGTNALDFYTYFADPTKETYSWNGEMEDNIAAFANGKVAMMLGYSYMIPTIRRMNPDIDMKIAPLPQIDGSTNPVTVANYWGWAVSHNSTNQDAAWTFLKFISDESVHSSYLSAVNKASALQGGRAYTSDRVFAQQASQAKSIFKGNNEDFDNIIIEMIDNVVKFKQPSQASIDAAARQANEEILAAFR